MNEKEIGNQVEEAVAAHRAETDEAAKRLGDGRDVLTTYEQLLDQRNTPPNSRPYCLRWAKLWIAVVKPDTASATEEFFDEQGRRPGLQAWQFQQGVRAVAWLARDILHLPWAESFDWRGIADAAKPLEPDHRTMGRESIPVSFSKEGFRLRENGSAAGNGDGSLPYL